MTDRPNFSGTWRADFTRSRLEIEAPSSTEFQMAHEDPELLVTRTHKAGDYEDTFSLKLSTDGRETTFRKDGREVRVHCEWQGASILFRSRFRVGEEQAVNEVRYTLSGDGQTITADERYSGPPKGYHNEWVLVRIGEG